MSRPAPVLPRTAERTAEHTAERYALFLDVDGTLLKIAAQPDRVRVTDSLRALLQRFERRLDGALALISGRALDDLDRLFAPLTLRAAGVHGLERRAAGETGADSVHLAGSAEDLEQLRAPLAGFARGHGGLLVEDKGQSLALHYRNAPQLEAEATAFIESLIATSAASLDLTRGKMVLEVRPGSADKGTAIEAFMAEPPFAGRVPVFIGDDVTDEDGFRAVNRLKGLSIRVGTAVETAAAFALPDEDAVFAWLEAWLNGKAKDDAT